MPDGSLNGERGPMDRQVNCECGYVAQGRSDDEVIALVQEHLRRDHPDLAGTESDEDIRAWIEVIA
jgi:predicted small metal-binding protein